MFKKLKCDFDGQCQINILNRHVCAACRLKKCLEVGMCPQMIRAPLGKKKKNINGLIQKNIQRQQVIFRIIRIYNLLLV